MSGTKPDASTVATSFTRAVLDRNMTMNTAPVSRALENLDLSGLAVLDFGCGHGNLLRLLKNTNADVVYALEVMPEHIDADILAWANNFTAKPKLVINPVSMKQDAQAPHGDLTAYDYERMLKSHKKFAIVSNPPYFLYNRILSLSLNEKFAGALMITSKGRLHNHPGWHVLGVMNGQDFDPPAYGTQYLVQTGFDDCTLIDRSEQPYIHGHPQPDPPINDREPLADITDHYPEMWKQLNDLRNRPKPA